MIQQRSWRWIGITLLTWTFLVKDMAAEDRLRGFLSDPSRPFVYIEFDHVGKRKPVSEKEPSQGLWLRVKNNTRIPIQVMTFEPGTGDPGVGILHEVIRVVDPVKVVLPPGQEASSGVDTDPPKGYSLDVGSKSVISPKSDLLFSVPFNHLGPSWYLRVMFEFELPPTKSGRQPYSFVDFTWSDIPAKSRSAWESLRRPH